MTDRDRRQETAAVVLYWIQRRGMTRQIFADRMGKSLSWVDKIRAGDRQLDRLSVLRQIASVLTIPLSVLIDPEEAERQRTCPDDREIEATNVLVHRVSALADMQSGGRVIEAAAEIPSGDLMRLPRERRASHLLDVTRGHLQAGQRDEAATTLLDADQLAREEVRCRHKTRLIITELIRSYPRGTTPMVGVTKLARALGVAV